MSKLYVIKAFGFDNVDDIEVVANDCRQLYLLADQMVCYGQTWPRGRGHSKPLFCLKKKNNK